MRAYNQEFTKLINGNKQFIIPVFQRDYSWSEPQCRQLWTDILNAAEDNNSQGHFIGSFVHMLADDSSPAFTRWLVVDGQQRLTTIVIILAALRDYLKDNPQIETDEATANRIDRYYLKNIEESGDRAHKLVLRRKDNKILTALLDSKKFEYSVMDHEPTPTSEIAAKVRGGKLEEGAKALVLRGEGKFFMFVLPADRRLNLKSAKAIAGTKRMSLATPQEVLEITGCEIGSVPPFGNLFNIPLFVDVNLLKNEKLDFNTGLLTRSISMNCPDYLEVAHANIQKFVE